MNDKWIQEATSKNKGSLRKALKAKKGEKIAMKKLDKAAKGEGVSKKVQKKAVLAKTLRKMD